MIDLKIKNLSENGEVFFMVQFSLRWPQYSFLLMKSIFYRFIASHYIILCYNNITRLHILETSIIRQPVIEIYQAENLIAYFTI